MVGTLPHSISLISRHSLMLQTPLHCDTTMRVIIFRYCFLHSPDISQFITTTLTLQTSLCLNHCVSSHSKYKHPHQRNTVYHLNSSSASSPSSCCSILITTIMLLHPDHHRTTETAMPCTLCITTRHHCQLYSIRHGKNILSPQFLRRLRCACRKTEDPLAPHKNVPGRYFLSCP